MIILAIDPGSTQSAYVIFDTATGLPRSWAKAPNDDVLHLVSVMHSNPEPFQVLAIEMTACYGMTVGRDLFDTARWIGRFIQAWGGSYNLVLRKSKWGPGCDDYMDAGRFPGVCMTLCKINTAKDTNIRQAIIDRYGGDKATAIGVKAKPGPLYGIRADQWQALAVAITWAEHMGKGELPTDAKEAKDGTSPA